MLLSAFQHVGGEEGDKEGGLFANVEYDEEVGKMDKNDDGMASASAKKGRHRLREKRNGSNVG